MADKTIAFTVDEEFHRRIKVKLAESGQTLKSYIINLILQDLENGQSVEKDAYTLENALDKANEIVEILNQISKK